MDAYAMAAHGCSTHSCLGCPLSLWWVGPITPGHRISVNISVTTVHIPPVSPGTHLSNNLKGRMNI